MSTPEPDPVADARSAIAQWGACTTLEKFKHLDQLRLCATALRASLVLLDGLQGTRYSAEARVALTVNLAIFQKLLTDVRPHK